MPLRAGNWLPQLFARYGGASSAVRVVYKPVTDSTNLLAQRLLTKAAQNDAARAELIVIAGEQTAGEGRYGRVWVSRANAGLWFTVAVWGNVPALCPPPLIAVAADLVELLQDNGVDAQLKWPNDVFLGDAKLAGMMAQATRIAGQPWLLCGVGLNWSPPQATDFDYPVAGLAGVRGLESSFPDEVISRVVDCLKAPERWGALVARQSRTHLYANKAVEVSGPGLCRHEVIAREIDHDGRLCVLSGRQTRRLDGRFRVRLL